METKEPQPVEIGPFQEIVEVNWNAKKIIVYVPISGEGGDDGISEEVTDAAEEVLFWMSNNEPGEAEDDFRIDRLIAKYYWQLWPYVKAQQKIDENAEGYVNKDEWYKGINPATLIRIPDPYELTSHYYESGYEGEGLYNQYFTPSDKTSVRSDYGSYQPSWYTNWSIGAGVENNIQLSYFINVSGSGFSDMWNLVTDGKKILKDYYNPSVSQSYFQYAFPAPISANGTDSAEPHSAGFPSFKIKDFELRKKKNEDEPEKIIYKKSDFLKDGQQLIFDDLFRPYGDNRRYGILGWMGNVSSITFEYLGRVLGDFEIFHALPLLWPETIGEIYRPPTYVNPLQTQILDHRTLNYGRWLDSETESEVLGTHTIQINEYLTFEGKYNADDKKKYSFRYKTVNVAAYFDEFYQTNEEENIVDSRAVLAGVFIAMELESAVEIKTEENA